MVSGDPSDPILGSDDGEEDDSSSGSGGGDSSSESDGGSSSSDADGNSSESNGEYRTVEVGAGERETVEITDGETHEDVLYDVTADGAAVFFNAHGSGWTLRSVGVRGVNETDRAIMHASVPDAGGEGRLENVYFGDGTTDGGGVGIWVDATKEDAHRGTLVFDKVHVARFADNGIYASGPGYQMGPEEGGVVHVRNSYGHNNNISQFRLGTDGSTIQNSLSYVDDDVPSNGGGGENPRGVWLREDADDILVEDSTVAIHDGDPFAVVARDLEHGIVRDSTIDGRVRGRDNLTFENVDREAEEDPEPPDGVPMSAEEAASG